MPLSPILSVRIIYDEIKKLFSKNNTRERIFVIVDRTEKISTRLYFLREWSEKVRQIFEKNLEFAKKKFFENNTRWRPSLSIRRAQEQMKELEDSRGTWTEVLDTLCQIWWIVCLFV